jgi:glycosyltransferase involved in cell wall biosynthesis
MWLLSLDLFYSFDVFCEQRYGGISRYYFEIIRRISPMVPDIKILAGLYINEYIKSLPVVKGIKVPALKYTGSIRRKVNRIFQAFMLRGTDSKTIIHQTFYYQPYIKFHGKIVVTVYDMISEIFPQYFPDGNNISLLKRRCCERADKVIAISHSTKNDLVRFFDIPSEKIVVTHLASSLKANNASPSVKPFREPYLFFVGEREDYKNFDGFIEAFAASESLKKSFHIVCFGGQPLSWNEYVRLKELGIEDRVHNVRGSDGLLCDYYRNAVAFICPSFYEGFGIPILEAMELSCPVVCSNIGSIPEVAGDAAVYFDPSDTASMQHAMEISLFDKNLLDGLKKRGLERQSMFSWDRCADETLAVYNSLIQ